MEKHSLKLGYEKVVFALESLYAARDAIRFARDSWD